MLMPWRAKRGESGRRGVAAVELAITAPILVFLMFSIVEFGLMFRTVAQLNTVAREAARAAAAGDTPYRVYSQLAAAGEGLDMQELQLTLEYREYTGYGTWGETWYPLTDAGGLNSAPLHAQIRAAAQYSHGLTFPGLFSFLVDPEEDDVKTLTAVVIMTRN